MRSRCSWLLALTVLGSVASVLPGQSLARALDGSIDVGAALLRQPDLAGSGVLTLASTVRVAAPRSSFAASGIAARTPEDRFTTQALVTGSLYGPPAHRLRWELAATGTAFGMSNAPATLGWQLLAREHLALRAGGVFLGGRGGATRRDDLWRQTLVGEAGGFLRLDPLGADALSAAVTYTRSESPLLGADAFAVSGPTVTRFTDVVAFWEHDRGRLGLLAGGGVRFDRNDDSGTSLSRSPSSSPWATVGATLWLTPRIGIAAGAGRALADVARGVPSVRYASLALRIGWRDRPGVPALRSSRPLPDDDGVERLLVSRGEGELRVITVVAPGATTVEIMADFTEWEPVALPRDPEARATWSTAHPIAAGTHRIAVRVDGGEWHVPANLPRVPDGFGGTVGLLTVP